MITKFIEAVDATKFNWGKFSLAQFSPEEWERKSEVGLPSSLLYQRGWTPEHIWVLDLQTGEGAWFRAGGSAAADLSKHGIWVCPMYEPFLTWLYLQDLQDISALPAVVDLGSVPTSMSGFRRPGKETFETKSGEYVARLAAEAGMTPIDYLESCLANFKTKPARKKRA